MEESKQTVWKRRIEEFLRSRKTQVQYAKEPGIRLRTFQYWHTKYKHEPLSTSETQWLEFKTSTPEPKTTAIILEIDSVRVAVTEDIHLEFLKNVIRVLKET